MDFLRTIVSGNRKRYKQNGYNLDLTYITERIIAMSFPASGFESAYRNNIKKVAKFLKQYHNDKYCIFNLSGRRYDYSKFNNKVQEFPWADHHAPPLPLLLRICQSIFAFLEKDRQNVVVVHCEAGKGRTGTVISSMLVYGGYFSKSDDALDFYGRKRFNDRTGVTQPSQRRYVNYLEDVYKGRVVSPQPKELKKFVVYTKPDVSKFKPYFEIYHSDAKTLLFSSKKTASSGCKGAVKEVFPIFPNQQIVLCGDFHMSVYNENSFFSDEFLCRTSFNTSFISRTNVLTFYKDQLDPDSVINDTRLKPGFHIELHFSDVCDKCNAYIPIENLCEKCLNLASGELTNWSVILNILNKHTYPTSDLEICGSAKLRKRAIEQWNIDRYPVLNYFEYTVSPIKPKVLPQEETKVTYFVPACESRSESSSDEEDNQVAVPLERTSSVTVPKKSPLVVHNVYGHQEELAKDEVKELEKEFEEHFAKMIETRLKTTEDEGTPSRGAIHKEES